MFTETTDVGFECMLQVSLVTEHTKCISESKEKGKDQESIQSSTISDVAIIHS